MLENLPGPTTFIPPDVMELIKSVKLDISSIPAHLAPKNAMEDFDRFIAEFYPCVGLREELQKRLNAANVGKVHVSWNEDWLRRVDGTLDPVEKENEIRKAVSNFLGIMNDVEKDYEVIDLGPTSRIDVIDLDPTRRIVNEDFGPTPEHRKGKGSLVETLPDGKDISQVSNCTKEYFQKIVDTYKFQQNIIKTNLQPVSQRSINQERVN